MAESRRFDGSTISDNNPTSTIPDNVDPAYGIQGDFLYLTMGVTDSSHTGTYSGGKFIIRLFGAPTDHLNDIE